MEFSVGKKGSTVFGQFWMKMPIVLLTASALHQNTAQPAMLLC